MRRLAVLGGALIALAPALLASAPQPSRLPLEHRWHGDLTDTAQVVAGLADGEFIGGRGGRPLLPAPGRTVTWEIPVSYPASAGGWPVVLEFDEGRVIRTARIGSQPLRQPVAADRVDVEDGRSALLLPLTPGSRAVLTLEAVASTAFHRNGFGRARLREATLTEVLTLGWADGRITVVNGSEVDLRVDLHLRHEDFFGVELGSETLPVAVGGGQRRLLTPRQPVPAQTYKTLVWTTHGERTSLPYWHVHVRGRELMQRESVLVLREGWEVSYADSATPPESGWEPVRVPHQAESGRMQGHAVWYGTTVRLPADWPEGGVFLRLQRVQYGAEVFVDGRPVGVLGWHDLPARVRLPDQVRVRGEARIDLRVADYTHLLAPGVPRPEVGRITTPTRGLGAPIGPAWALTMAGLPTTPELYSAPRVHTQSTRLATTLAPDGGWRLESSTLIDAGGGSLAGWKARLSLRQRGVVLRTASLDVPANGLVRFDLSLPQVLAWTPETPHLHEWRIELLHPDGEVADTYRERFGFREFKATRSGFLLNGQRVRLHGGSHVQPESRFWPLRMVPHVLLRYDFGHPDRFLGGPYFRHAAEESGYLIKAATPEHNAHGADAYGYEHAIFWERARAHWENNVAALANSPSIVIWDLGNEVSFGRPGDAAAMQALADHLRALDPAREVTIGGSAPGLPRAAMVNLHGGGFWASRLDHFMLNPQERPSYLRDRGIFARRPDGDPSPGWRSRSEFLAGFTPRAMLGAPDLAAYDGRPILWAEGHYVGEGETSMPALLGNDYFAPHVVVGASEWDRLEAMNQVHYLAGRLQSIAVVRQAGSDGSMIHVNRGFGRPLLPVAALPFDRNFRAWEGSEWASSWTLLNDTGAERTVEAAWRLVAGGRVLATATAAADLAPGGLRRVEIRTPLPTLGADTAARLEVEVRSDGRVVFDDVHAFSILVRPVAKAASAQVYDPERSVLTALDLVARGLEPLERLADWDPARPLLLGANALRGSSGGGLKHLRDGILGGSSVAVLEHENLPGFLPAPLNQTDGYGMFAAPTWTDSPLLRGLEHRDFQTWLRAERDGIVVHRPLEIPLSGNWLNHVDAGGDSALLELRLGRGRVLFCQLTVASSAVHDPVALRMLGNLVDWLGTPSPFVSRPAFIAGSEARFARVLREQYGVQAEAGEGPTPSFLGQAGLLALEGTDRSVRTDLLQRREEVLRFLRQGGTLFVHGLDPDGAAWLSELVGTPIGLEAFAHRRAHLTGWNDVTRGTLHGVFFFSRERRQDWVLPEQRLEPANDSIGTQRITGPAVRPLLAPTYLAEIPVGSGRVVVSTLRSLDYPTRTPRMAFALVLSNLGFEMQIGGIASPNPRESWSYSPIDLGPFANHPLSDQPDGRRGFHGGGPANDLSHFPRGEQKLNGVDYLLIDPDRHGGNGVIALSGTKERGLLPAEVKGIPVNRRADRLHFLHNSAWGLPGFVYRVWYEDRRTWIFGRPDPFVDVVIKPGEDIADWYDATPIARGEMFAPGLTLAWKAANPTSALNGREVGVYEKIWENPHPEKVIESIDILSPGTVGSGQVFVFAITAATRAGPTAAPKPLAQVYPGGAAADVAAEFFNGRYGLVLRTDGSIPSIYDERGIRLASLPGWRYEVTNAGPRPPVLSRQQDQPAERIEREEDESGSTVFRIRGTGRHLGWEATIVCRSAAIEITHAFTLRSRAEGERPAAVQLPVQFEAAQFAAGGTNFDWRDNPQMIPFRTGLATLGHEPGRRWFATPGYWVTPDAITYVETMNDTVGTTASVRLTLTLP